MCVLVAPLCLTLSDPTDCSPPDSSVYGDSPAKNTGMGCYDFPPGDLPNTGVEARSPALQADSLPAERPGKPMAKTKSQ